MIYLTSLVLRCIEVLIPFTYVSINTSWICLNVLKCCLVNLWLPTMAAGTSLFARDGELLSDAKQYSSLVGALQYYTLTRLDLSFVVNKACQFFHAPTTVHWNLVKRILRYLSSTRSLGLSITSSGPFSLTCYINADWDNCPEDRRSTNGFCVFLGDDVIT